MNRDTILAAAGLSADKLILKDCVDSTNLLAVELAADGAEDGTVVLAEAQTGGRGRRGRSFFSPAGTGVYLSIIVRHSEPLPNREDTEADVTTLLTAAAGVAAVSGIERAVGIDARLKWVNDIVLDGVKVGGILAESRFEGARRLWTVVGIGINVFTPPGGFPPELAGVAGALFDSNTTAAKAQPEQLRERVAGSVIRAFAEELRAAGTNTERWRRDLHSRYCAYTAWLTGQTVNVNRFACALNTPADTTQAALTAVVTGISENFELTVEPSYELFCAVKGPISAAEFALLPREQRLLALNAGEISVKPRRSGTRPGAQ